MPLRLRQRTSAFDSPRIRAQSQFSTLYGDAAVNTADKKKSVDPNQNAAAAILVYDQPHRTPVGLEGIVI